MFWLKYGILLGDPAMISVNIIGIIFQFAYIFFYYYYASEEQKVSEGTCVRSIDSTRAFVCVCMGGGGGAMWRTNCCFV